jgi:hypothetical protein
MRKRIERVEVTCARCGFTKYWTQKQWDRHMLLVHDIKNEVAIGATITKPQPRLI